ncbi:NADP-dependent oxidoreductase [Verticiella sediminum]|uniref:NADP-dependent oxidoreductase n=1 Tax=Verticiella sediminum TaxID=1247510 RepID=A0A556B214_9BURK|nr:NADP-dependent oxidoreductase [Verticiella sediminum]TSH99202.1 NADP-dependent oxidoreductase [Verticiella sediminum]
MTPANRRIALAARPRGLPVPSDFALVAEPVPVPGAGQFLVAHEVLGLAPAARLRMSDEAGSYAAPLQIGDTVYGQAVGRVVASRHPDFREGEWVMTMAGGWQDYSVTDGTKVWKIDPALAPPAVWLGALGVSGMTAWIGLREIGRPRAGETVVVSAASGAVGSCAAQFAQAWECRVIGIAGGTDKCRYAVDSLGLAACVDYRAPDFAEQLRAACPQGVDVYFENVGGAVRETVWPLLNQGGRVVVCGLISEYNRQGAPEPGPAWSDVLAKRLCVQGFILSDRVHRQAEFVAEAGELYRRGRLRFREDASFGLEQAPAAFIAMLQGRNLGKSVVHLTEPRKT